MPKKIILFSIILTLFGCFEKSSNETIENSLTNSPNTPDPTLPEKEALNFNTCLEKISDFINSGDTTSAFKELENIEVRDITAESDSQTVIKGLKEILDKKLVDIETQDQRIAFARIFNQIAKYEKDLTAQEQSVRKAYLDVQEDLTKEFIYFYAIREIPELETRLIDLKTN